MLGNCSPSVRRTRKFNTVTVWLNILAHTKGATPYIVFGHMGFGTLLPCQVEFPSVPVSRSGGVGVGSSLKTSAIYDIGTKMQLFI